MPFDYSKLIPLGIGAGSTVLGGFLQARGQNQANARQDQLLRAEMARRNALQSLAMPSALHAMGYRNPAQIDQAVNSVNQSEQSLTSGYTQPARTGSTAGTIGKAALNYGPAALGIASKLGLLGGGTAATGSIGGVGSLAALPTLGSLAPTVASMTGAPAAAAAGGGAGLFGLGAATIPVIGGLAAGAYGASRLIGRGRRAANRFVENVQNPFDQRLAQISQRAQTDPKGALAELQAAYQQYMAQNQAAQQQGGNNAKVAQQALNNPAFTSTINQLFAQTGGRR